jgi:cell division septum initiation protein DivIVA
MDTPHIPTDIAGWVALIGNAALAMWNLRQKGDIEHVKANATLPGDCEVKVNAAQDKLRLEIAEKYVTKRDLKDTLDTLKEFIAQQFKALEQVIDVKLKALEDTRHGS